MSAAKTRGRGPEILRRTFGGTLYQQGRGFYAAFELLAILRGEILLENAERDAAAGAPERVLPREGSALYLRRGHDYARRVLAADETVDDSVFADEDARRAVRSLLEGLEAQVPGRRRTNEAWQKRHLYPYPSEAIHYDAVLRYGKVSIETYFYRGAGALAHKILRTDPDVERLGETRRRLRALLTGGEGAVGTLLDALAENDEAKPTDPFEDEIEARSLVPDADDPEGPASRATRWMALLREGVARIVTREDRLSDFERIDALVRWVPWCLARHQLAMSRRVLGLDEDAPIVFDAGHGKTAVRARARADLAEAQGTIKEALLRRAEEIGASELLVGRGSWWKDSRTFYPTTLFAIGALNANTGRRHHELRPEILQAIVHALVDEPMSFERFVRNVLSERLRIVCDDSDTALLDGLELDGRDLKANRRALVARLEEVGLARAYSDATLMVGVHE